MAAKKEYDGDRSFCVYPTYIDARKTVAEGRKVPASHAAECPSHQEIAMAIQHFRLFFMIEPHKKYSRDVWMMGRLRVKIFSDDGKLLNPEIKNRRELLMALGKHIASQPGRKLPPKPPAPTPLAERSKGGESGKGGNKAGASSSTSAGTAGKKGKK